MRSRTPCHCCCHSVNTESDLATPLASMRDRPARSCALSRPPLSPSLLCSRWQRSLLHADGQGPHCTQVFPCGQSFRNPKSLELLDQAQDAGGHREQNPISGTLAEPPGDDDTPIPRSEGTACPQPVLASCSSPRLPALHQHPPLGSCPSALRPTSRSCKPRDGRLCVVCHTTARPAAA